MGHHTLGIPSALYKYCLRKVLDIMALISPVYDIAVLNSCVHKALLDSWDGKFMNNRAMNGVLIMYLMAD